MQILIHELEIIPKYKSQQNSIWIYSNQIKPLPDQLLDENKCCLVYIKNLNKIGVYCKKSLIAVKILPFIEYKSDKIVKTDFVLAILNHLIKLQKFKSQFSFVKELEAFRLCHGDHDGLPSITIDDYQSVRVIQSSSAGGEYLLPYIVDALFQMDDKNLFERSTGQIRQMDGLPERTRWLKQNIIDSENFEVNCNFANLKLNFHLNKAQKTGLFLDQRLNLNFISEFLKMDPASSPRDDKNMLDICSYAGAWSALGAKNGLNNFTLIDQDAFALKLAEKNIQKNTLTEKIQIELLHGDMFEQLNILTKQNKKFNLVIADPPAFAKSSKHIFEAKRAYIRMIKLAASLTAENGLLVVCSCSRHINDELFYECVTDGLNASQQGQWILVHKGEQSPCHTRLMQTELSDYLKCYFLQRR